MRRRQEAEENKLCRSFSSELPWPRITCISEIHLPSQMVKPHCHPPFETQQEAHTPLTASSIFSSSPQSATSTSRQPEDGVFMPTAVSFLPFYGSKWLRPACYFLRLWNQQENSSMFFQSIFFFLVTVFKANFPNDVFNPRFWMWLMMLMFKAAWAEAKYFGIWTW